MHCDSLSENHQRNYRHLKYFTFYIPRVTPKTLSGQIFQEHIKMPPKYNAWSYGFLIEPPPEPIDCHPRNFFSPTADLRSINQELCCYKNGRPLLRKSRKYPKRIWIVFTRLTAFSCIHEENKVGFQIFLFSQPTYCSHMPWESFNKHRIKNQGLTT